MAPSTPADPRVALDPVYWQLRYPDGRMETEPPGNSSIMRAPGGASALVLVDVTGHPIQRLDIPPGRRPIFYRKRSISLDETPSDGRSTLDGTVVGHGTASPRSLTATAFDFTLWSWEEGGGLVDCPLALFDEAMVELQLTEGA